MESEIRIPFIVSIGFKSTRGIVLSSFFPTEVMEHNIVTDDHNFLSRFIQCNRDLIAPRDISIMIKSDAKVNIIPKELYHCDLTTGKTAQINHKIKQNIIPSSHRIPTGFRRQAA